MSASKTALFDQINSKGYSLTVAQFASKARRVTEMNVSDAKR